MRGSRGQVVRAGLALVGLAVMAGVLMMVPSEPPVSSEQVKRCSEASAPTSRTTVDEPLPSLSVDALTEAARSISPRVIVGAVVVDQVQDTELLEANGDRPFPSASLVKLLIAIDALVGADAVDDELRRDLTRMLSESDDAVASELWTLGGGAEIVQRSASRLGLTSTAPPSIPGQWGGTSTTPNDTAAVYEFILDELEPAHRELVLSALGSAPRIADDGFDQHFGIPEAFDGQWAIKQGWSTTQGVVGAHSTGIVGSDRRYIVIVLTEHPLSVSMETGARAVTAGLRRLARDL